MTLYQLGQQYLEEEKNIRAHIEDLRSEVSEYKGMRRVEFERRINSLYCMALDAGRIGRYLTCYYSEEGGTDVCTALKY